MPDGTIMTRDQKVVLFAIGMTASVQTAVVLTDDFKDGDSDGVVTADATRDG